MKVSELHDIISRNGWVLSRQTGSHIRYEKNGRRYTVPFHKGKEIDNNFARKILKDMGISK